MVRKDQRGRKEQPGHRGQLGLPAPRATRRPGPAGRSAPGVVVTHSAGPDSSHCGGDWANDDYTRTLQFIPQDDGTIQVVRTYDGTFTTIAGAHTAQSHVRALARLQTGGRNGNVQRLRCLGCDGRRVHAERDLSRSLHHSRDARDTFFPARGGPAATSTVNNGWEYQYDAGANGLWVNRSRARAAEDFGNITERLGGTAWGRA